MNLAFPWPVSDGEWMAFASAGITILLGLIFLIAPRMAMRVLRLQPDPAHPEAVGEMRSTVAGFHLGIGLCCLITGQFWVYMALGFAWIFAAFGRLVSILSDRGGKLQHWLGLVLSLLLGLMPLVYSLGLVP